MLQVLISTMYLGNPAELLTKMNIQSSAVIIDQCDCVGEDHLSFRGYPVHIYHTTERGLSRSRNMAIANATAEILIFADDDFFYTDGYDAFVTEAFDSFSDADIIVFNAMRSDGHVYRKLPGGRVGKKHRFSINSVRITAKRESFSNHSISFDTEFGAGADISGGEDTIFISDCFRKKLRIYSYDRLLCRGLQPERQSTWFSGYSPAYFLDRGAIYKRMVKYYPLLIFYFATKNWKLYCKDISFAKAVQYMFEGAAKR